MTFDNRIKIHLTDEERKTLKDAAQLYHAIMEKMNDNSIVMMEGSEDTQISLHSLNMAINCCDNLYFNKTESWKITDAD